MSISTLQFWHRGQLQTFQNVPPTRTLLQLVRDDMHLCGTKEGCNEGDCGACTVALRENADAPYKAINSCIRMAHSIAGQELTVVEDLSTEGALHPAQEAMVQCHGSQCGFCTPGFVMSMFALHENSVAAGQTINRATAQEALSGNLCRCTGYRPILDAAVKMQSIPQSLSKDEHSAQYSSRLCAQKASKTALVTFFETSKIQHTVRAELVEAYSPSTLRQTQDRPSSGRTEGIHHYLLPRSLKELLSLRSAHPQAQLVAGCTDVGLWINKGHQVFDQVLDVTQVQELRRIERYPHHIAIGAAVTLEDAYAALVQDRPQLRAFSKRFAGLTVRNSGTLGGNVANGSPIGDSMPLLIALKANVVLMSMRGHREMSLEKLYTGYRKNVMAPDEVLAWIKVPLPTAQEFSRVYKISKRFDDDISAVCLAISVQREGEALKDWSIGVGGVAATPVRAIKTEALCAYSMPATGLFDSIKHSLQEEFQPISDMRASAAYRLALLGNLIERFALELQGQRLTSLQDWADLHEVLV